jgi:hypothetical protein
VKEDLMLDAHNLLILVVQFIYHTKLTAQTSTNATTVWLLSIDALTANTGTHRETIAISQAPLDVKQELLLVLNLSLFLNNPCHQLITGINLCHQLITGIKINHVTIHIQDMNIQSSFQWHHAHKKLIFLNTIQIIFINLMVMALIIRMYANHIFTTYSYRSYEHLELFFHVQNLTSTLTSNFLLLTN